MSIKKLYIFTLIAVLLFIYIPTRVHGQDSLGTAEAADPTTEEALERTKVIPEGTRPGRFSKSQVTRDESEKSSDHRELLLTTGEDKVVDLDFIPEAGTQGGIKIGNPRKVAVTPVIIDGVYKQLTFTPLESGTSTVSVRDQDGTIRVVFDVSVTGTNVLKIASELRSLLRDVEGITIKVLGERVVIDGEVLVPRDYGRIFTVISNPDYAKMVLNLTTLSPITLQFISKRIEEDVKSFAPNVKTRVVNNQIWLEGSVDSGQAAERALKVADLYLPDIRPSELIEGDRSASRREPHSPVQSFLVVEPPPPKRQAKLVRVTAHFVELSKDYLRAFGFKWEPGFTPDTQLTIGVGASDQGGSGAAGGTGFIATISSLFPKLQSAQQAGFARILKTGTVIVRSGEVASLNDQTHIPIAVTGAGGQIAASEAEVGLSLNVTPVILGQSEDIQLELNLRQINIAGRVGPSQPIRADHQVHTKIYVKSNESAAVAAVESTDVQTNFNKDDPDPGSFTGDTDALFTLHRSKSYNKKKGNFVIFVTPQIIDNASEGTKDLKKNFRIKVN